MHGRDERDRAGAARRCGADPAARGQPAVHHARHAAHCLGRPEEGLRHPGQRQGGEEDAAHPGGIGLHGARLRAHPAAGLRLCPQDGPPAALVLHRRRVGRGARLFRGGRIQGRQQQQLEPGQLRRPHPRPAGAQAAGGDAGQPPAGAVGPLRRGLSLLCRQKPLLSPLGGAAAHLAGLQLGLPGVHQPATVRMLPGQPRADQLRADPGRDLPDRPPPPGTGRTGHRLLRPGVRRGPDPPGGHHCRGDDAPEKGHHAAARSTSTPTAPCRNGCNSCATPAWTPSASP